MQNLFYVPPHQPQDTHPKPQGVRSVVKRSHPTRLDLNAGHPALNPVAVDMGLVTQGDVAAEPTLGPAVVAAPRRKMRGIIGAWLVALGTKISGQPDQPLGQPV